MNDLEAFIPVINGHIDYFGIKKKIPSHGIQKIKKI